MDYTCFTCVELRKQLKKRQLETTGRKAELIARLQALDDAKRPPKRKAEEIENDVAQKMMHKVQDLVQDLLQCPICLGRMGGEIHQVKSCLNYMHVIPSYARAH